MLDFRWKWEQFIRAYTAYLAIQNGVNISQTLEKVSMKFRRLQFPARVFFDSQPRSGLWNLNKMTNHCNDCCGTGIPVSADSPSSRKRSCAPAYKPRQVARSVLDEAAADPNIIARTISALFIAKHGKEVPFRPLRNSASYERVPGGVYGGIRRLRKAPPQFRTHRARSHYKLGLNEVATHEGGTSHFFALKKGKDDSH